MSLTNDRSCTSISDINESYLSVLNANGQLAKL